MSMAMRRSMVMGLVAVGAGLALLGWAVALGAEEKPGEKPDRAVEAVRQYLKETVKLGDAWAGRLGGLARLEDPALAAFTDCQFVLLRFRQYPVGMMVPEGLGVSNLFAVSAKDEKQTVVMMTQAKALQEFCAKALSAKDEKGARAATHAYAFLRKELAQDGFFRFTIEPEKFEVETKPGSIVVKATVAVTPGGGNAGSITMTVSFTGEKGTFGVVTEEEKLRAGMRPICQSLKLTDPDAAVRARAEHDLLLMGANALPYLRMQAGKTDGRLREAIIGLIRRIESGERLPDGQPEAN